MPNLLNNETNHKTGGRKTQTAYLAHNAGIVYSCGYNDTLLAHRDITQHKHEL